MRIFTFKIRRMRIVALILSVGMQCSGLGQLNDCNIVICGWVMCRKGLCIN